MELCKDVRTKNREVDKWPDQAPQNTLSPSFSSLHIKDAGPPVHCAHPPGGHPVCGCIASPAFRSLIASSKLSYLNRLDEEGGGGGGQRRGLLDEKRAFRAGRGGPPRHGALRLLAVQYRAGSHMRVWSLDFHGVGGAGSRDKQCLLTYPSFNERCLRADGHVAGWSASDEAGYGGRRTENTVLGRCRDENRLPELKIDRARSGATRTVRNSHETVGSAQC